MIIIEGILENKEWEGLSIVTPIDRSHRWFKNLASKIAFMLSEKYIVDKSDYDNKYEDDDDFNWIDSDVSLENIILHYRIFDSSTTELILEETLKGKINIYTELTGYSSYTILGAKDELFKIDNIDLNELFQQYVGLYLKIEIEVNE